MGHKNATRHPPGGASPALDLRALEDPVMHPRLRLFVRKILAGQGAPRGELDDLVAEVVTDAAKDRRQYDPAISSVETWLASIARHRLANFFRRWKAKESRNVPEEEAAGAAEPVSPQLNPEQAAHAHRLLHALDGAVQGPSRDSFLLHAEGHTVAAIGRKTGLLPGAVKHRLERAGEIRDQALTKMGEKRESGADVRFGVLPLLLALTERTELPAGPSENDPSAPSAAPAVPIERPVTLPRPLVSGLLAAAALALVSALAMPVASGISPAQTGVFQPLPDVRTAAQTANSAPGSTPPPSSSAAGTATFSEGRPPVSSGPVHPDARPVRPAQHVMKKAGAQAPNDTNVLLRLGAGAARAGAHDTASSLLERHARQFPATEPATLAGLAREVRAAGPARR